MGATILYAGIGELRNEVSESPNIVVNREYYIQGCYLNVWVLVAYTALQGSHSLLWLDRL